MLVFLFPARVFEFAPAIILIDLSIHPRTPFINTGGNRFLLGGCGKVFSFTLAPPIMVVVLSTLPLGGAADCLTGTSSKASARVQLKINK